MLDLTPESVDQFLDSDDRDAALTGGPGRGKTYSLLHLILPRVLERNKKTCLCAPTNQAVKVMKAECINAGIDVDNPLISFCTVHQFLGWVPMDNSDARNIRELKRNVRLSDPRQCDVAVFDESSMLNTAMREEIVNLWDDDLYEQALYVGDPDQLLPPEGKPFFTWLRLDRFTNFHWHLTDPKRTNKIDVLEMTDGISEAIRSNSRAKKLRPNFESVLLKQRVNDVKMGEDDIFLAYTNATVQDHNQTLAGKVLPEVGDLCWSPTLKRRLRVLEFLQPCDFFGWGGIGFHGVRKPDSNQETYIYHDGNDRYNSRQRASRIPDVIPMRVLDIDTESEFNIFAYFGTESFRRAIRFMADKAIESNSEVKAKYGDQLVSVSEKSITTFCRRYRDGVKNGVEQFCEVVEARQKSWSNKQLFEQMIVGLDFNYCRTVHSSQGSSFENVYIDADDMMRADNDTANRLNYVALSRARGFIYIVRNTGK